MIAPDIMDLPLLVLQVQAPLQKLGPLLRKWGRRSHFGSQSDWNGFWSDWKSKTDSHRWWVVPQTCFVTTLVWGFNKKKSCHWTELAHRENGPTKDYFENLQIVSSQIINRLCVVTGCSLMRWTQYMQIVLTFQVTVGTYQRFLNVAKWKPKR